MTPSLLVTGASGQVGGAVVTLAKAQGMAVLAPPRAQFDLADLDSMTAYLAAHFPAAIINCAAYTAVDKAEDEPELAHVINAQAPALLARYAAAHDIPLLHVSTDYVFDGTNPKPYAEDDAPNPLGIYGQSKLAGEQAIIASGVAHCILRTAWVVSAGGANFITTMLRLAETRDELGVVDDQIGCPTSADDIAEALLSLFDHKARGTYHFVNTGTASWHDLAAHVFARAAQAGFKTPMLNAIPTSAYPTRATRPVNSVLDTTKFTRKFGAPPRPWQEAINTVLDTRLNKEHV